MDENPTLSDIDPARLDSPGPGRLARTGPANARSPGFERARDPSGIVLDNACEFHMI